MQGEELAETLSKPIFKNGVFSNPWSTWSDTKFSNVLKWALFTKNNTNLPSDKKILDQTLPVHPITDEQINDFCKEGNPEQLKMIWIGHATCLVNIENCIVLVDPVFSDRCSPSQNAGPKRFRPVPITIDRLSRVDAVV